MSNKSLNDTLRNEFMEKIGCFLTEELDCEFLLTNSNEYAIPCVDAEGNEKFLTLKFSIPSGSRDGDAYDGYAVADEYKAKVAEREEKAKAAADKKVKKIAADKAKREQLAKAKAEREANANA